MSNRSASKLLNKEPVDLNWVLKYLKDGVYPTGLNFSEKRMIRKRAERFCYLNGDLYYLGTPKDQELGKKSRKVLLTHEERMKKVHESHIDADDNHLGLEKTAEGFISDFHWVGIYSFIKDFIRQCPVCKERHPNMNPSRFTGQGDESLDDESSTIEDDSSIYGSEIDQTSVTSLAETSILEQEAENVKVSARMFWEKVDIRLFGPYKFASSTKYILVALDGYSLWPEAFVLDTVSPTTVAQSLLKMICRYGEVCSIILSCEDEVLEASLVVALEVLKTESDIQIPLKRGSMESTEKAYGGVEDLIDKFVKKYPKSWPECIDLCLLPLRMSRNKEAEYTPSFLAHAREPILPLKLTHSKGGSVDIQLTANEQMETIDVMMATHQALQGSKVAQKSQRIETGVFNTPKPSPVKEFVLEPSSSSKAHEHVTRSRTGNAKPKPMDDEQFDTSTPKRKAVSSPGLPVSRKKVKVEAVMTSTPNLDNTEEDCSDSEGDVSYEAAKKPVDLDTYYQAIKQYVSRSTYPDKSSNSFKRLIRDQAKNYCLQDGELYHEVGAKKTLKKIIMTKAERVQLLIDMYLKTSVKTQMLVLLDPVHWKGKLIDCEAFLLALHNEKHQPQSSIESWRHLAEAKKQLEYDTMDTYKEIKNFIVYDVFSDDDASKRLDYLKRQFKNFRVENDELYHVNGNKKRKVVTSAASRQQVISNACQNKKGTNADLTSVFNQVSETAFWFAMKLDIKICLSYTDNKHLLERYFTFREHFMHEPLTEPEPTPDEEEEEEEEGEEYEEMDEEDNSATAAVPEPAADNPVKPPVTANVPVVVTKVGQQAAESLAKIHKPGSIFVSTVNSSAVATTPQTTSSEQTQPVSNSGDAAPTPSTSQTIIPDQPPVVDSGVPRFKVENSKTVIVRMMDTGEMVMSSGDGTESVLSKIEPRKTSSTATSTGQKASDDVTVAAVKSILQDPGTSQAEDGSFTVSQADSEVTEETVEIPAEETTTVDDGADLGHEQLSIAMEPESETVITSEHTPAATDGESQTIPEDEIEDSDDGLYDTDEEEEDIYDDDEDDDDSKSDVSGMTSPSSSGVLTMAGEKKVTTPRQHFKCSQCDKLFFGPLKFKMHMYKHTGQKPFPCNLCNKKYTNKKSLVIHQRTHTGELPYLCSLCGKRCASKIALKSHLKCHDGKGGGFPAKCDVCQRVFSRRHLMERHKLHKHTNAQSEYKCSECLKVFGHQRSLKRHFMSAHMGVKNHVCGMCGKAFCRKEYLTGHLIQHGAAEGIIRKARPSTSKPRPSVFNQQYIVKKKDEDEEEEEEEKLSDDQVQRIILHQDENGQLRVVDMAMEKEVRRMLENRMPKGEAGETMVVHIEEPGTGEQQVVHVEQTEEQVVEVPLEEQNYVEYQQMGDDKQQEYVINASQAVGVSGNTQYIYTSSQGEFAVQGNQELIYGQPAVQYEVECVGDVGDEEALSAINLLAQASAQQYETVISQI